MYVCVYICVRICVRVESCDRVTRMEEYIDRIRVRRCSLQTRRTNVQRASTTLDSRHRSSINVTEASIVPVL
jgi:hypothetical protein